MANANDDPHRAIGIALIAFYSTIAPDIFYILYHNWHDTSRMAWKALGVFIYLRFLTGIFIISRADSHAYDTSWVVVPTLFFEAGLVSLFLATIFVLQVIMKASFAGNWETCHLVKVITFTAAIQLVLFVVSAGLSSQDSTAAAARILAKTAHMLFTWMLAWLTYILIGMHRSKTLVAPQDMKFLLAATLALPLLTLRTAYGLLQVFYLDTIYQPWNPIYGSFVSYLLMALLPEFVVAVLFTMLGFYRIRKRSQRQPENGLVAGTAKDDSRS